MCECLEQVNRLLAPRNLVLVTDWYTGKRLTVATRAHKESKRKTEPVIAVFCPFCGQKYPREKEKTDE